MLRLIPWALRMEVQFDLGSIPPPFSSVFFHSLRLKSFFCVSAYPQAPAPLSFLLESLKFYSFPPDIGIQDFAAGHFLRSPTSGKIQHPCSASTGLFVLENVIHPASPDHFVVPRKPGRLLYRDVLLRSSPPSKGPPLA